MKKYIDLQVRKKFLFILVSEETFQLEKTHLRNVSFKLAK